MCATLCRKSHKKQLFNKVIEKKLNTKSYESYEYSSTLMSLDSVELEGYRKYTQNDLASFNAFTF